MQKIKNFLTHKDFKKFRFDKDNSYKNRKILTKIYEFMLKLRIIETRISNEYHPKDLMRCPIHFCVGQEAAPSVVNLIIKKKDYLFSHHRSHGYYLAKNCSLKEMIAELYGKSSGSNKGFAGSQDISNYKKKFFAGAIVSGSIGIAIGAAFAIKYKKQKSKVIVAFGEGAIDQGIFWEAINLASLYKLPILFLCENNLYATYSHFKDRVSNLDTCQKVKSFGVHSKQIFGNDVASAYYEIKKAYNNLGRIPYFIELLTYRQSSHVGPEDDSKNYRNSTEKKLWKNLCPIKALEKSLNIEKNKKKKLINKINSELSNAFKFAEKSDFYKVLNWENLNLPKQQAGKIKIKELQKNNLSKSDTIPEPY